MTFRPEGMGERVRDPFVLRTCVMNTVRVLIASCIVWKANDN